MISVLLVDDQPVVRQGLRALLQVQDGIVVAGEAGDGPTAVSLATSLRPDIVLLDLKLPGMDGIEVCRRMRGDHDWTPVLFVTARDDEVDRLGAPL